MSETPITSSALEQFITATQPLNSGSMTNLGNINAQLVDLQTWQQHLLADLRRHRLNASALNLQGDITKQINELNQWIERSRLTCQTTYQTLVTSHNLGELLDSKVILLVFGKFNAGKSSLCNLLADCFRQAQQAVQYFYIQDGDVIFTNATFQEGATETTARLQGMCLAENLVLLDTPGLHSVTAANAALTQRFMESADGVLWLSSSSSPGQVRELDTLAQELHRQKPLLPVITRSDYLEEDEIDGEICHVLRNKSAAQRALQEQDVQARAIQKLEIMALNTALLKPPVSISAHMAKQYNFSAESMTEAGIDELFLALSSLIEPALSYKQCKPAEIFLHYLQEDVFEPLQQGFNQRLTELTQCITTELTNLATHQAAIIEQVWRTIVPLLPDLMDKYRPLHSVDPLLNDIAVKTQQQLQNQLNSTLTNSQIHFKDWQTLSLIRQVSYQTDEESQSLPIANEEQLYKNICDSLMVSLHQTLDNELEAYRIQLQKLLDTINQLQTILTDYQNRLISIASDIRRVRHILKTSHNKQ